MRHSWMLIAAVLTTPVWSEVDNYASITQGSFNDFHGHAQINQAAGYSNLQFNFAALAHGDYALASVAGLHSAAVSLPTLPGKDHTAIDENVALNVNGRFALNATTGIGNVSGNVMLLALGEQAILSSSLDLSSVVVGKATEKAQLNTPVNHPLRQSEIYLADTAFNGGQGMLQLNIIAGSGNRALNVVSMTGSW